MRLGVDGEAHEVARPLERVGVEGRGEGGLLLGLPTEGARDECGEGAPGEGGADEVVALLRVGGAVATGFHDLCADVLY